MTPDGGSDRPVALDRRTAAGTDLRGLPVHRCNHAAPCHSLAPSLVSWLLATRQFGASRIVSPSVWRKKRPRRGRGQIPPFNSDLECGRIAFLPSAKTIQAARSRSLASRSKGYPWTRPPSSRRRVVAANAGSHPHTNETIPQRPTACLGMRDLCPTKLYLCHVRAMPSPGVSGQHYCSEGD
jgi:hypothetical protein